MYKKTAIRKYFKEYLSTLLGIDVYCGRIDPLSKKTTFPYITIYSKNDTVTAEFTSHTEREMDILIGVNVRANQTEDSDFDEIIENLMYTVESYMSLLITVPSTYIPIDEDNYRLFEDVVFTNSLIDSDNSSGNDYGMALMNYKLSYNYESPIKPLELDDFDWEESIKHIQITNEGVPEND